MMPAQSPASKARSLTTHSTNGYQSSTDLAWISKELARQLVNNNMDDFCWYCCCSSSAFNCCYCWTIESPKRVPTITAGCGPPPMDRPANCTRNENAKQRTRQYSWLAHWWMVSWHKQTVLSHSHLNEVYGPCLFWIHTLTSHSTAIAIGGFAVAARQSSM